MSLESITAGGEKIQWSKLPKFDHNSNVTEEVIDIGKEELSRATFMKGINEFLSGENRIELGRGKILRIPETTDGNVVIGETELPYDQFVRGAIHAIAHWNGRTVQKDTINESFALKAFDALEKQLLEHIPQSPHHYEF